MDRLRSRRPQPPHVLVMVEEVAAFRLHRRRLEAQGYQVVSAADAGAALTMARQTVPRLIFLSKDPSGSGRTPFLVALRSDDHTRHIPVAAVSTDNERSLERLGLRAIGRELW